MLDSHTTAIDLSCSIDKCLLVAAIQCMLEMLKHVNVLSILINLHNFLTSIICIIVALRYSLASILVCTCMCALEDITRISS